MWADRTMSEVWYVMIPSGRVAAYLRNCFASVIVFSVGAAC